MKLTKKARHAIDTLYKRDRDRKTTTSQKITRARAALDAHNETCDFCLSASEGWGDQCPEGESLQAELEILTTDKEHNL